MRLKYRTVIYISASLMLLVILTIIGYLAGAVEFLAGFEDINYFDLLVGQVANTLIVLSLTSVLSENFGQAYWVDIKDTKLVNPFWGCFIGITLYLLTALVFSVVMYALGFNVGVVISACFATALLIILTFKMISIYFGKEELKKQLRVEYRHMMLLRNNSYITDYLRKLKKFADEIEDISFMGKNKYVKKVRAEIQSIENSLNTSDDKAVEAAHNKHIDNFMECEETLKEINRKLVENTQNAINSNDSEVVRENIELLVECENYTSIFSMIEELFEWDEKYACKTLRDLGKTSRAWVVNSEMQFFKKYALQKLITQSGKLDAIRNLLMIYDPANLGMDRIKPEIKAISEKVHALNEKERAIHKEINETEDFRESMRKEKDARILIQGMKKEIGDELLAILKKSSAKDLRIFYVPIREACIAYEEGNYEITNKYINVILEDFNMDLEFIKMTSCITDIEMEEKYEFSYLTEDEKKMVDRLIEKDGTNGILPENTKTALLSMSTVVLG